MNTRVTIYSSILISVLTLFCVKDFFPQNVGSASYINTNNIYLPFDNKGDIADINIPGNYSFGYYGNHQFLFGGGFYLSGFTNDSLWANAVASAILIRDYQPGTAGMDPNDPTASLYKVSSSDIPFGQSWQDWTNAVNLGAEFYDGDHNGIYNPVDLNNNGTWDPNEDKPDIIGDETFWCVYNDGVPANQRLWGSEPQGIEIRQTIFAFAASSGAQSNTIFIRYRIINTGLVSDTLKGVYFCNFADADIGEVNGYNQNLTGIDTIRNADYTYMNQPSPTDWGNKPPCFMTDMLTGPVSYIPGVSFNDVNGNNIYDEGIDIPLDTAFCFRGLLGVPIYPGALNLKLTSSIMYLGGDPNLNLPQNIVQARNNLLGLTVLGNVADPCNWVYGEVLGGVPCNEVDPYYWFSGDPVLNIGWISAIPVDVRNIQSVGPFKLIKNKEIEILVAYEVGQGNSPLGSVTVAKSISDEIQSFYENNFGYPYVLTVNDNNINKIDFALHQNYPNPFNPATTIRYSIPKTGLVKLAVYDILGKEVKVLTNEEQTAGTHEINFDASRLSSGIYFYRIQSGNYFAVKKMILIK